MCVYGMYSYTYVCMCYPGQLAMLYINMFDNHNGYNCVNGCKIQSFQRHDLKQNLEILRHALVARTSSYLRQLCNSCVILGSPARSFFIGRSLVVVRSEHHASEQTDNLILQGYSNLLILQDYSVVSTLQPLFWITELSCLVSFCRDQQKRKGSIMKPRRIILQLGNKAVLYNYGRLSQNVDLQPILIKIMLMLYGILCYPLQCMDTSKVHYY